MEIEVKGHSGCMVKILTTGRSKLLIDKSTKDTSYFPRLLLQAKKQQAAGEQEYQHIRIPKIERIVQDERHVSVIMEYVYSRNFIEYFEAAGFEQINYSSFGSKNYQQPAILRFFRRSLQTGSSYQPCR
jgi:hypothetical protein